MTVPAATASWKEQQATEQVDRGFEKRCRFGGWKRRRSVAQGRWVWAWYASFRRVMIPDVDAKTSVDENEGREGENGGGSSGVAIGKKRDGGGVCTFSPRVCVGVWGRLLCVVGFGEGVYPVGRLVRVLAGASLRSRLGPLEESVVSFRVWPGDLDSNLHLNNGRYLTLMDLGRWDLMGRVGLLPLAARARWAPVVAAATVRFRRSLEPFQRYDLRTRLLGWDERAFYVGQTFGRGGEVHASAAVRAVVLARGRRVAPQEAVDALQAGLASPTLPEWVLLWQRALDAAGEASASGDETVETARQIG